MKFFILLFAVFITSIFGCKKTNELELDYCQMLSMDQSIVNSDSSDKEKYDTDRKTRKQIFKENLYKIIYYAEINGFPEMGSLKASGIDSCRNWVTMITLFHIGQSQPHHFFEDRVMQVLEKEIVAGRLRSGSMFSPLREGFENHEFCLERKEEIHDALRSW